MQDGFEAKVLNGRDHRALCRTLRFPWMTVFAVCALASPWASQALHAAQQRLATLTGSDRVAVTLLCVMSGLVACGIAAALRRLGLTLEQHHRAGRGVRSVEGIWSLLDTIGSDASQAVRARVSYVVTDMHDGRIAELTLKSSEIRLARVLSEGQPLYRLGFRRSFTSMHAIDHGLGLICSIAAAAACYVGGELVLLAGGAMFAALYFLAHWARAAGLTPGGVWNASVDAGGLTIMEFFSHRRLAVQDSRLAVLPLAAGWLCCVKAGTRPTELLRLDFTACALLLAAWTPPPARPPAAL